jgi:membrane-bound serine protease (ClpP class)
MKCRPPLVSVLLAALSFVTTFAPLMAESAPLMAGPATSFTQNRVVTVLTLAGPIDPISARYVQRGLDRARQEGAQLAVIELDTPGGLGASMDQIVDRILASPVPVAVYVWPQGARAASAGVFIAMAAHVAVMAPGTHIGAAHPVDSGGGDISGVMGEKILNDAAAKLKALAELRGRDPAWADQAVRRSMSLTESQAVSQRVVDLSARDLGDMLAAVDGRTVMTQAGPVVIHSAAAEVRRFRTNFIDWLLGFLVNPDIAYILLVVGIFGVIFEISSPGAIAPGVAGALALLMAFISFGNLPTNIGGIVFILLSIVLFIVDLKTPTHGLLTAGGVVAFVLGSFLLFPPGRASAQVPAGAAPIPHMTAVHVSFVSIGVMTMLVVAFFVFVLGKGILAQSRRISFGAEALVGSGGVAVTDIAPEGLVQSAGERWSARAEQGSIRAGERVEIVGREGLCLLVRRANKGGIS